MKTRQIITLFASLAALCSCGVSAEVISFPKPLDTPSGLTIIGKTLTVLYDSGADSLARRTEAFAFADELDKIYFPERSGVRVFRAPAVFTDTLSVRRALLGAVMQTESDVVFAVTGSRVYAYDSLSPADRMLTYAYGDAGALKDVALMFEARWQGEEFYIYTCADGKAWTEAQRHVGAGKWKEAMNAWLDALDDANLERRAAAEYNLALGAYLMGDQSLAGQWLDRSWADARLEAVPFLRKKIEAASK